MLVANLATNFQDLVAKVKNLVALAPVLGAISRPALVTFSQAQKQVRLGLSGMSYKEPLKVCNLKDRPKIGKRKIIKPLRSGKDLLLTTWTTFSTSSL